MIQQCQWQEAAEVCRQGLTIKSDVSWLYHNLGYAEFKLKHWQESSQALLQAIELNSNFPWSHFYFGETLVAEGEQEKAVRAYLAAIELDRDLPGVYKQLGIVLRQQCQANLEAIVTHYQQNPPLSTKNCNSNFYSQLATNLVQYKQLDGAIIFYRLASALEPDCLQINQQLQQVQTQKEQRETEIDNLRDLIRENPQTPHLYNQLGNLLADLGEYQEASRLHRQTMILRGWHLALETRNYQFHYDWFTHNISVWEQHIHWLKQADSVNVLEIGSYEGMATCWLLDHILTNLNASITCIDLYFQPNFEHNIAQTGAIDKVTQLVGNSQQILPTLKPHRYDLIYIDGSHLAEDARKDALLAWDLLKENGLMIFDDYEFKIPATPDQEPKIGIDNFLLTISAQFKTIHQEYQLIIQKVKSIATKL
jgi:tetratricopeptide (TPR) repeat protein